MHGAKEGADALVGVANSVGNAYVNVRDAIAKGILGKELSLNTFIKYP